MTPSTTNTAAREVVQALRDLLRHVEVNTCTHEETHRGGAIWTICDSCDRKWADDRGGFVPHEDAPEVVAARAALESFTLTQQQGGEQDAVATFLPTGSFVFADSGHDGELNCDCFQVKYKGRTYIMPLRWSNEVIKPKPTPPHHPADEGMARDAERLDWLSQSNHIHDEIIRHGYGSLRDRIDAAIQAPPPVTAALAGREAGEAGLG